MISVSNVSFSYDDGTPALEGVSLDVPKGEFLCIVGHNGSGKSTLAKMLNGLLLPSSGTVTVAGMDTADDEHILDIRRLVGMVFQNPDNQIVTTVVREDVAFGPENLGVPTEEMAVRVDEAIKAVGMESYAESAPHMLSGGQKQRIAIAGMLAMDPEVLVLDEATAMLDPMGRRDILRIVRELHEKKGITVIMITQYMEEAVGADRVIVMNGGHIVMEGTPAEVFRRGDELRAIRLDVPAAVELRELLLKEGIADCGDAMTLEELSESLCRSLLKN
ncbi:MAG: energy-coupling factor transporter ATPase [Clostridia bacterium]|nr:energy-coupling factor transporter ATPase [Clostridia bacterium]MBR4658442.1 energy-coupling factor transporter ATPase [Clostridia bacterium]